MLSYHCETLTLVYCQILHSSGLLGGIHVGLTSILVTRCGVGALGPAMMGPTLLGPSLLDDIPTGLETFFLAMCRIQGPEGSGCGNADTGDASRCQLRVLSLLISTKSNVYSEGSASTEAGAITSRDNEDIAGLISRGASARG